MLGCGIQSIAFASIVCHVVRCYQARKICPKSMHTIASALFRVHMPRTLGAGRLLKAILRFVSCETGEFPSKAQITHSRTIQSTKISRASPNNSDVQAMRRNGMRAPWGQRGISRMGQPWRRAIRRCWGSLVRVRIPHFIVAL